MTISALRSRRRGARPVSIALAALTVIAAVVLPTAAASAAAPTESISLDRTSYWFASTYFAPARAGVAPTVALSATVSPAAASQDVDWSTSDAAVATVNSSGVVTAVAPGAATITATSADGGYRARSVVHVPVLSETFDELSAGVGWLPAKAGAFAQINGTVVGEASGNSFQSAMSGTGPRGTAAAFPKPATGQIVDLDFDWQVGAPTNSNGAYAAVVDAANNRYFSLERNNGGELVYATGGSMVATDATYTLPSAVSGTTTAAVGTGFNLNNTWYAVHAELDFAQHRITFTVTSKSNPALTATHTVPFAAGISYTGGVASLDLAATRSSSTMSWTTKLDNVDLYSASSAAANPADSTISSIALTTAPLKSTYAVGEPLNLSGTVVTATWADGSTTQLDPSNLTASGFDPSQTGSQTVTLALRSNPAKTVTFAVTVDPDATAAAIVSIAVSSPPDRTVYVVGDELDLAGLIVTASLSDGTTATVNTQDVSISGYDPAATSRQTVTVALKSAPTITATFDVTVSAAIASIALTSAPDKTTYTVGDQLDLTGLVVTATLTDGTTRPLDAAEFSMRGFDGSGSGDQTVTVALVLDPTKTVAFHVTVDQPIVWIGVTTMPTTTRYTVGGALDLSGLVVTAGLADGSQRALSADEVTTRGFDGSRAGRQNVTVQAKADPTKTDAFQVTVGGAADIAPGGTVTITNDQFWKDTDGYPIYAQGGGVFDFPDPKTGVVTHYWYGVHYVEAEAYYSNPTKSYTFASVDGRGFVSVDVYSSLDLKNWKFENSVVTESELNHMDGGAAGWLGRLGVTYLPSIGKYAMLVQENNTVTGQGQELVLTSTTPTGKFTNPSRINMNDFGAGADSTGDQTVFNDDDGKGYLVYSKPNGRNRLFVAQIVVAANGGVTLGTYKQIYTGVGREGDCMFKYDGKYYFTASDLYGWNASNAYYLVSDSIFGDYTPTNNMLKMTNVEADYGHVTQTGFYYTLHGSEQDTVIFAGDRWADFAGNGLGYNQWTPLSFSGAVPAVNSMSSWDLNNATGEWSVGAKNNFVLNPSFEADRVAVGQVEGWTYAGTSGAIVNQGDNSGRVGNFQLAFTSTGTYSASASQDLATDPAIAPPDGMYTLTLWARHAITSAGAGFGVTVTSGGRTKTLDIKSAVGSAWQQVTLSGIHITGGAAAVSIAATNVPGGQWANVDDVVLTRNPLQSQTISFAPIADHKVGDADFEIDPTSDSSLPLALTADGACTIDGDVVHVVSAGSCSITAAQAGDDTYAAASPVTQSFIVAKGEQRIDLAPIADRTYGDPDFAVTATASSGLPVGLAASGVCTIDGTVVHVTLPGTCAITASQSGGDDYNPAQPVSRTFTVTPGAVSISAPGLSAPWGTAAELKVTVTSAAAPVVGQVRLMEGTTVRGLAGLTNGKATFVLPVGLTGGEHQITATYLGSDYLASRRTTTTVTVILPGTWDKSTAYQTGDRVSYDGSVFEAAWYSKGEQPGGNSNSAWEQLAMAEDGETAWTSTRIFTTGDLATFDGKTYRAAWYTRGDVPGSVKGPWEEIATAPNGIALWTSTRIFNTGDEAVYNGHTYTARWYTRNDTPGSAGGPWVQD